MAAVPEPVPQANMEDKDSGLFVEGHAESSLAGGSKEGYSAEYQEYLRLANEVFVGDRKKKLLRQMDIRVTVPLAFMYLVGYIDRSNIGNARLFGLEKDLKITPGQYNMVLTSFFITYALFEIPSQILNKKIGPKLYVSGAMVCFGITTMCTAFCFNYAGIIVCRLMLGIFESGLFPGVIYVLSYWYSRWELQTRISIFYGGASASGAFAGLLAYAIANLDNHLGYRAWRWIFGIEGLATILIAIGAFFFLSEAPAKARWLTEEEKRYLTLRQIYGNGPNPSTNHFEWKYVMQALRDWKAYVGCLLFFGTSIPVYGLSFAMPTIVNNLGYSAARAQALTAPPYLFGCFACVAFSVVSDRIRQRAYVMAAAFSLALCGFAIVMGTAGNSSITGVTLFGIFLTAGGLYSATPPMMAWVANIFEGEVKRGIALSIVPTIGQFGGIVGSNIYLTREKPYYRTGFGVSIGVVLCCGLLTTLALRVALARVNKNRDKISVEEIKAKYTDAELTEMGDWSPLIRYPL